MRDRVRNARTGDRGPPEDGPDIFTVEQIGPKREKTPNGNLVCRDVPIARVGWMIYADGETPIEADPSVGYARVYRGEEELFSPKTIGSFMGVAVTDEHPDDDVDPTNWDKLSRGFSTTNVRRGEGEYADCLIADLIVTHADLIKAIDDNKREVSCGYSADYRQTGVGTGVQTNIIGNHIALVEKGRCGPRCAIGDQDTFSNQPEKELKMSEKTRVRLSGVSQREQLRQRMRTMVRDMDSLLNEASDPASPDGIDDLDDGGGATHIHIHAGGSSSAPEKQVPGHDELGDDPDGGGDPLEQRIAALEQGMAQIADAIGQLQDAIGQMSGGGKTTPDADPDPDVDPDNPDGEPVVKDSGEEVDPADNDLMTSKTGDSAALATSFQQLLADAEILVPGIRVPTFDAKAKRKVTMDSMCSLRRKAIVAAMTTRDGAALIEAAAGPNCDPEKMDCQQMASVFRAAVTARRVLNNASATRDANKLPNASATAKPAQTIEAINKANAEFWARQGA